MFFVRRCFRIFSLFYFLFFRRHAFYSIKTMVLAHSTLSDNLNSISSLINKYQKSYQCRYHFHIDLSSIFMFFRHRCSHRFFHRFLKENASKNGWFPRALHPGAPFSRPFPKIDLWTHFWSPFALGSLLAPFWLPLASFWLSFGSLLAPFWYPLANFCSPWESIFSLLASPGVVLVLPEQIGMVFNRF